MNKASLIFVRHGESEANLAGVYVGHIDAPLTERGHAQAELTAEYLKNEQIAAVYASDLSRAFQTAEHIASKHGLEVTADKNMREIYAGKWEGKRFSELLTLFPAEYGKWLSDIGTSHPDGGESVAELYERITKEAALIASRHMGERVVVATHATPIRMLTCHWRGLSLKDMHTVPWVHNASVSRADYYEDGSVRLISTDEFDFMGKSATALPKNV